MEFYNQTLNHQIKILKLIRATLKTFIFLPEMTPRIVITENPDAGVFAQKLNKYAIKIAGTPWNKTIKMVAPRILNYCQLLVEYKIIYQGILSSPFFT